MHWRERYAYEAEKAATALKNHSEEQLLERVRNNSLDPYFATWRALAKIGTIEKSAMVMWEFLERSPGKANMLHRYHCAAALFQILNMPDPASQNELRKQVQWDSKGEEARQEALLTLKAIIENKLEYPEHRKT